MLNCAPFDWFNVCGISHGRIGHNRGWVGIDQDDSKALFTKCFTGLSAGVVKLTGLANNNWASTKYEDAFYVSSFWHVVSASA